MTSLGVPEARLMGKNSMRLWEEVGSGRQPGVNGKLPFGVVTNHEMLDELTLLVPLGPM